MKRPRPVPRLYAIADAEALHPLSVEEGAQAMAEAGVRWIQVRAKRVTGAEWYRLMEAVCRRLEGSDAGIWVDDRVDLATLFPVLGVHLGVRDLAPADARRVVGEECRLGLSTHDRQQLEVAAGDPEVNLVAVGPVFPTTGKANPDPVVGLDFVRRARAATAKPLVAIGGIDAANLEAVLAAGADSAAVLGAACRGDVAANCRRLLAAAA